MPFAALGLAPKSAMDLLGADIWRGFYGPTREVQETDVVPYRMMGIIDVAIRRLLAKHESLVQTFDADKANAAKAAVGKHRKKEEVRKSGVRKSGLKT